MRKTSILLLIVFSLFSCQTKKTDSNWSIAYKNDKSGNVLLGSKQQLINSIRKGASIKIGWGGKGKSHQIEHIAEPIWIAILDEKEVVAHLDPQVLSGTDWDALSANYADSLLVKSEWRVVITTKGEFDAVWYDRQDYRVTKHRPQNHVMTWFIKDVDDSIPAEPLFNE